MKYASIPRNLPTPGERGNGLHLAKARQRGAITQSLHAQADDDRQRDADERALDHAVSRNIEHARRQYVLSLPGSMHDKLDLLGV